MPIIAIVIGIIVLAGALGFALMSDQKDDVVELETAITVPQRDDTEASSDTTISGGNDGDDDTDADDTTAGASAGSQSDTTVSNDSSVVDIQTDTAVVTTPDPAPAPEPATVYADGTYNESTSYRVPNGGNEPMTVSLTLSGDVVTAASVSFEGAHGTSVKYQEEFADSYKAAVVGKSIDTISLSRVGGASLTSKAFNSAVAEVKADAKI